jgi:hypothetical protein
MRLCDIVRPLSVVDNLWCRVHVVRADQTPLTTRHLVGSGDPDLGTVDDVAQLALLAGRLGGRIILSDVTPALRALLELSGLGVEMEWEAK